MAALACFTPGRKAVSTIGYLLEAKIAAFPSSNVFCEEFLFFLDDAFVAA
jgi:hypothetical protein